MRKAPGIVFALVLVLAVCLMFIRLLSVVLPQEENEIDTSAGMSYLAGTEQTEITESLISEMTTSVSEQTTETETVPETSEETTPETTQYYEIKDGNFRAAYDDIIIAGDSLVKAIAEYGILDDDQVIAEIGAHTRHLSSVTDQIVYSNPKYLVLHYGENELDEEANAPYFISRYKECIIRLQEELPDTEIFVGSIFPVQEKAHRSEPYTVNIPYYNELLKEMSEELGVHFIDYDPWWETFDTDYYEPDGIHPVMRFYTEQYLPYVYNVVMNTK